MSEKGAKVARLPVLDVALAVLMMQYVILSIILFFVDLPIEVILPSMVLGGIGLLYIPISFYRQSKGIG